jgi:hypothetical protein
MAEQPRTIREVNIGVGHLWKMAWFLVSSLGAILATIAGVFWMVSDVRTKVATIETKLDVNTEAINKRLELLQKGQESIRDSESQMLLALGRVESRQTGAPPPLSVSDSEAALIRQVLKVPVPTGGAPKFSIGDLVPDAASKPLPAEIPAKLSQLKDVRYVVDPSNAIALIDPRSSRIFAII